MSSESYSTVIATIVGMAAAGICLLWKQLQTDTRYLSPRAQEIHNHIQATQKPARLLGIRVDDLTDETLTLSAPLSRNTNVHGTAFAGSLYSVAVLCSYYLARSWTLRNDNLGDYYTLVAKAGNIQYRRPVSSGRIVAKSFLPKSDVLEKFRLDLAELNKASMTISGKVLLADGTVACEYSTEICAYRPR